MYLSLLKLDMTRTGRGRSLLRNVYHVHQRLWMGFADHDRKKEDRLFLDTWDSSAPAEPSRSREFLFRIEPDRPARILVQSLSQPDWDWAFQNAPGYLVEDGPIIREVTPRIETGQVYRFRLTANPTKRPKPLPTDQREPGSSRPRQAIRDPDGQREWLGRKLADAAELEGDLARQTAKAINFKKPNASNGREVTIFSVLLDGYLRVSDPDALLKLIHNGIGPAKAFGCGLLSLAPA